MPRCTAAPATKCETGAGGRDPQRFHIHNVARDGEPEVENLVETLHEKRSCTRNHAKQGREIGALRVAGPVQQARQGKGRSRGVAKKAVEARTWGVHRARAQASRPGREMLCRKG
jgi:hypothetical protein